MKSLLLKEYGHLEIAEMERPEPGPGEVLVRVAACGICGSDVHGYDGSSGRRIPPLVMGHEAAGTVAGVGAGVRGFRDGDRVTFDSTVYCGDCDYCRRGEMNLCDRREVVGVSCGDYRRHGAFAEFVTVPERIVYRLPDAMRFSEAAMLEAISVALHAVHLSGERAGQNGAGGGRGDDRAADHAGGAGAGVCARDDCGHRCDAAGPGAEAGRGLWCCTLKGAELVDEVRRQTGGHGADVVLEAVGRNETVAASIDAVRKGGTVVLIGNITPEVNLPLQKVVSRQIRLQGSAASCGEYPEAMELVAGGKIRIEPLITAVASLEEGPRWFERLHAGEPNLMKVVLSPDVAAAGAR